MKLEQFMSDFFRPEEEITVQAIWLQEQLKTLYKKEMELASKERTLQGYQHKCDRLEAQVLLLEMMHPVRLDERV